MITVPGTRAGTSGPGRPPSCSCRTRAARCPLIGATLTEHYLREAGSVEEHQAAHLLARNAVLVWISK